MRINLEAIHSHLYLSDDGRMLHRPGRLWILRDQDGFQVDVSEHREDIAERNGLRFQVCAEEFMPAP